MEKLKKVLIITYYWPPAGGSVVQRILRFIQYLPEMGWQPVILTTGNGDYPVIDEALLNKVPEDCKVFRTPVAEPHNFYKKFTGRAKDEKLPVYVLLPTEEDNVQEKVAKWIRRNIFIPDSRIGWMLFAVKAGLKILETEDIDIIFSSSPPNTVQLIAKKLARKSGKKWIADFRDPWSDAFWVEDINRMALSKYIDIKLEKSVLRNADAVTTVSDGIQRLFSSKVKNKYKIIQNGFEPPELKNVQNEKFIILFTGHLNKHENPGALFQAVDALPLSIKEKTKIIFVGKIFEGFQNIFEKYERLDIERKGFMSHQEMISFAQSAAMLFNPIVRIAYADGIVGAKIYDYLSLRKPILTLVDTQNSVSEVILKETLSGEIFHYEDIVGITGFIQGQFQQWKKNGYILLDNEDRLTPYTTRYNVKELVKLFEEIINQQ